MDDICRLCCSTNFVNNNIFDEENALYIKMSLYLPIKVLKNDRLPQKVCDKCSCKVNDIYQFCNETVEVQNRLRSLLLSSEVASEVTAESSIIKQNVNSPTPLTVPCEVIKRCDQGTQTEVIPPDAPEIKVKVEVTPTSPLCIKEEAPYHVSDDFHNNAMPSDDSDNDNVSLISLKKKKQIKKSESNGTEKKKKRKIEFNNFNDWDGIMTDSDGSRNSIEMKPENAVKIVKNEPLSLDMEFEKVKRKIKVKKEPDEEDTYQCCICLTQCYSRTEMTQHYRAHGSEMEVLRPPSPPPAPDQDPLRCSRCSKSLERSQWAEHWTRHWLRDQRPYRCALCEKTFRHHLQILKHGLTHKMGENGPESSQTLSKRFVCDLCPEGFVYMRYLLAHRTGAHPEAAGRALALRCAVCARTFAHLNSLRRHLRAHSGERNFLCNVCGKALSSQEHLKFHIRIHTGDKSNVCKTCGKGFVKKCNLTLHERVHSGEKPHVCSHCGKAFSQRSTLVIHERYHSGARPYVCGLCGRGFVAKGLLSMHLKTTCI